MPRWAIERQLGNLGQALRRATEDDDTIRSTISEVEQAIAFQTAIAKRYDGIDNQVVWATVIEDMDPLRRALQKLLTESGEPLETPYT